MHSINQFCEIIKLCCWWMWRAYVSVRVCACRIVGWWKMAWTRATPFGEWLLLPRSLSLSVSLCQHLCLALRISLSLSLLLFIQRYWHSRREETRLRTQFLPVSRSNLSHLSNIHTHVFSFALSFYLCHTCALSFLLVTCSSHQVRGCTVDGMVLV